MLDSLETMEENKNNHTGGASPEISEDRSREMSNVVMIVTADQHSIQEAEGSPERFLPLDDIDLPSRP
jgi:hypothetical protein